ncbi:elongation factor 2 [Entomortierella parvispora]|uniref:Elongation factor 2 n=1 Tax=Entomortierella parvispora TaxID=205924 RepID=A0A9P3H6Y9_9FUNG|nr:elongation factor 2 [Entomortierella parvispora]
MVNFTVEQIRDLMGKATNIRNMSILALSDHQATELINILTVSEARIDCTGYSDPTCLKDPNHLDNEDLPVITKTITAPLYFEVAEETLSLTKQQSTGSAFFINLIEPPRNIDIYNEVAATFGIADGALIVVNCVDPIPFQIRNVLRQVISVRAKPLLVLNQIEPAIQESNVTPEELYQSFVRTIESVNSIVETYHVNKDAFGDDLLFHPDQSTVAFASGKSDWAFTIDMFAQRYAKRFGVDRAKIAQKFWGDSYFNMATKKWATESLDADGQPLERSFVMFILNPIFKLMDAILTFKTEAWQAMLQKLEIKLSRAENELNGKALLKVVMNKFLPAKDALLEMSVLHLPSPVTAQKYRVETLYEGPMNDECAAGIRRCDPDGPLMMHISKMIRTTDKGRFYGLGRVFSGTIRAGARVRIMGPSHTVGTKTDLFLRPMQRLVLMSKGNPPVVDCPAGNVIGVVGVDQFLLQSGTITSSDSAYNMRNIKFSITPVVGITVAPKDPNDLTKLVQSLTRLARWGSGIQSSVLFTGEHFLSGPEEQTLNLCLQELEKDMGEVPIVKSEPFVQYRETVQAESSATALSKTPNRHSRFFMRASPLSQELTCAIESGKLNARNEFKVSARALTENYGWSKIDARNIWAFGPDAAGSNLLVDCTHGVSYLNEIKEAFTTGFNWATRSGVFTEEPVRGCRFNILDVVMTCDAIHRGGGQIIPGSRSVIYASMFLAQPGFMEPVYSVDLICPERFMSDLAALLERHRGVVLGEEGWQLVSPRDRVHTVKAHLPVAESSEFLAALSKAPGGQAVVCQMVFDHWKLMPGVINEDPQLIELVKAIRKRKGLEEELPKIERFLDRL